MKNLVDVDWSSKETEKYGLKDQINGTTFWNYICLSYFPVLEQFKASENLSNYLDEVIKFLTPSLNEKKQSKNRLIWKVQEHLPSIDLDQGLSEITLDSLIKEVDAEMTDRKEDYGLSIAQLQSSLKSQMESELNKDLLEDLRSDKIQSHLAVDCCYQTTVEKRYLEVEKKNFHQRSRFEKKVLENFKLAQLQERRKKDEEVNCAICNCGDYENKNMIVFCDSCGIAVHQNCYGINNIPEHEWRCFLCLIFGVHRGRAMNCSLCGRTGGAMRPSGVPNRDPNMKELGFV